MKTNKSTHNLVPAMNSTPIGNYQGKNNGGNAVRVAAKKLNSTLHQSQVPMKSGSTSPLNYTAKGQRIRG